MDNAVTKSIIKGMQENVGSENAQIYKDLFGPMSKKEFDDWMDTYLSEDKFLHAVVPNGGNSTFTVEKGLEYLKKNGGSTFGPMVIETEDGIIETPIDYFVIYLPIRLPTQTVEKGMAVSEGNRVNILTGQTNSSSKMTAPETGILYGLGMNETLKEILRTRGGDVGQQQALSSLLATKGEASMDELAYYAEGVTSTVTLDTFFKGIHIKLFDDM